MCILVQFFYYVCVLRWSRTTCVVKTQLLWRVFQCSTPSHPAPPSLCLPANRVNLTALNTRCRGSRPHSWVWHECGWQEGVVLKEVLQAEGTAAPRCWDPLGQWVALSGEDYQQDDQSWRTSMFLSIQGMRWYSAVISVLFSARIDLLKQRKKETRLHFLCGVWGKDTTFFSPAWWFSYSDWDRGRWVGSRRPVF